MSPSLLLPLLSKLPLLLQLPLSLLWKENQHSDNFTDGKTLIYLFSFKYLSSGSFVLSFLPCELFSFLCFFEPLHSGVTAICSICTGDTQMDIFHDKLRWRVPSLYCCGASIIPIPLPESLRTTLANHMEWSHNTSPGTRP